MDPSRNRQEKPDFIDMIGRGTNFQEDGVPGNVVEDKAEQPFSACFAIHFFLQGHKWWPAIDSGAVYIFIDVKIRV